VSSDEPLIPYENFISMEHTKEPHMQNHEDLWITKSFGDDYFVYLMDNTSRTTEIGGRIKRTTKYCLSCVLSFLLSLGLWKNHRVLMLLVLLGIVG
jgi:hypothetical protein